MHIQANFLTRNTDKAFRWLPPYRNKHLWWDAGTNEVFWLPVLPYHFTSHPAMPILRLTDRDYEEWPLEEAFRAFNLEPAGLSAAYNEVGFKYNATMGSGFVSTSEGTDGPVTFQEACQSMHGAYLVTDANTPYDPRTVATAVALENFRWLFRCPQLSAYLNTLADNKHYVKEYHRLRDIRGSNEQGTVSDVFPSLLETGYLFAQVLNPVYYGNDLHPYENTSKYVRYIPVSDPIVVIGNYIAESCDSSGDE